MILAKNTVCNTSADDLSMSAVISGKYHPRDVEYGLGTIRWGDAVRNLRGDITAPAGWVLPGGERVSAWQQAHWAAMAIHDVFVAAKQGFALPAVNGVMP